MTLKSWIVSSTDTWRTRGRTFITHYVCSPMISIVHVAWLALVLSVLLPWIALDFLPKRKPRPLTTPRPTTRKLPIPLREGSDIFVIMPDGERVPVEPLAASSHAQAWAEVVAGAFCYEKTKIRVDESR